MFDICLPSEGDRKIGQCAIGSGRKVRVFVDSIQLLPNFQHYWPAAMAAILARLGPGYYHYGSEWSIEAPREHDLAKVPGIDIIDVEAKTVDAVDFSRWNSWDAYYNNVSSNIRRNVKRAEDYHTSLTINTRKGTKVFLDSNDIIRLRLAVYRRKGIHRSPLLLGIRYALKMAHLKKYALTATATSEGQVLSAFSGISCGSQMYYLEGGSQPNNNGASWSLLVHMLKLTYEMLGPKAKFIFGSGLNSGPGWHDLVRSREQCRFTSYPTSLIKFRFTG
jgi:hypothetical protein